MALASVAVQMRPKFSQPLAATGNRRSRVYRAISTHYLDRVSEYDAHNRVFYIFYLGCFNNYPIYHYGESYDIDLAELKIKRTLPFYERVYCAPIGHKVNAKHEFDEMIKEKKVRISLPDVTHWEAFTTDDFSGTVMNGLNALFYTTEFS